MKKFREWCGIRCARIRARGVGYYAAWVVIVTAMIMILVPTYFYTFHSNPPLVIESHWGQDVAEIGGPVLVSSEFCRNTDTVGEFTRRWVNVETGVTYLWDLTPLVLQGDRVCTTRVSEIIVPDDIGIVPGTYVMEVTANYPEVNFTKPPRTVHYVVGDPDLQVVRILGEE